MSDQNWQPISEGAVNWRGLFTLVQREVLRFSVVWTQTLAAPLFTAGLFLAVFSLALGADRPAPSGADSFTDFLVPGILMMSVIQNAFANTSSSLVISKIQGNIVDTLMPPLSATELMIGYLAGGVLRGLLVAVAIGGASAVFLGVGVAHPLWALVFVLLGGTMLSALGALAGIVANKFDQMAAITNFIITPLAFLSGTFYSVEALPPLFQAISHANPVFYLINGMRYAMTGQADASPVLGAVVCVAVCAALMALCWRWLATGYRLKS